MSKPINILMTARDPSTANSFAELALASRKNKRIHLSIISQGAATRIFNEKDVSENDQITLITAPISDGIVESKCFLNSRISALSPDAILAGVSGPDNGIDEAALILGHQMGIETYAFQSFCGDIHPLTANHLKTILVSNEIAKHHTSLKTDARIEAVGDPKYDHYQSINIVEKRIAFFTSTGLDQTIPLITFMGQPLMFLEGYIKTITVLAQSLAKLGTQYNLIYRPHPKESQEEIDKVLKVFVANKINPFIQQNSGLEELYCATDLQVNLFSTTGLDYQILNSLSDWPLGITMYLMFDSEIIGYYQKYTSLEKLPYSNPDIAITIDDSDQLLKQIEGALKIEHKTKFWYNLKSAFNSPGVSSSRIFSILLNDFDQC